MSMVIVDMVRNWEHWIDLQKGVHIYSMIVAETLLHERTYTIPSYKESDL